MRHNRPLSSRCWPCGTPCASKSGKAVMARAAVSKGVCCVYHSTLLNAERCRGTFSATTQPLKARGRAPWFLVCATLGKEAVPETAAPRKASAEWPLSCGGTCAAQFVGSFATDKQALQARTRLWLTSARPSLSQRSQFTNFETRMGSKI